MGAELMRALCPKITLPLDVAAVFWSTWAEVYAPGGAITAEKGEK